MSALLDLTRNHALIAAVVSWVAAQVIKTILTLIKTHKFEPERLFGAGGMPSAHSAAVCSLTLVIARTNGLDSAQFAISFILAAVVMYDAMGVRRAAGEHARVLNVIMRQQEPEDILSYLNKKKKELKEILGHTPLEVISGALLGILIAMLIPVS